MRNTPDGARIEAQGPEGALAEFRTRLHGDAPPHCRIWHVEETWIPPQPAPLEFEILTSSLDGPRHGLPLPDLATCPDCLAEILDPRNRRFRYPFTNCTACGPRFSIIEALPYDRSRTVMRGFPLCADCRAEYADPSNRRFHAEPMACAACGPRLAYESADGRTLAVGDEALAGAVDAIRAHGIVALKGLGGFQLIVRADSPDAVARLRERKGREAKPFALMVPALDHARALCEVEASEERLLASSAAPIVLLRRREPAHRAVASEVAPGNPFLGLMLPSTPLHHLLLADLALPVVATSGNRSDEPLCFDNAEARERLRGLADGFLLHDRPIARPVDDSVARVVLDQEQVLRRARGYAPLPISCTFPPPTAGSRQPTLLAVGGHLKNAIAVLRENQAFLGPHLGDLESLATAEAFERALVDLPRLLDAPPDAIVADLHPDYLSSQRAERFGLPLIRVPHHEAHAWACLGDNGLRPPVLAFSWDGTGLGPDRTLWGGEALELTDTGCHRRAWFRPFPLPGGDAASRDIRRSLLGVLHEARLLDSKFIGPCLARLFGPAEIGSFRAVLLHERHAPRTSSVGRLFDAIAALLGIADRSRYEGEAAQRLEWAALSARCEEPAEAMPIASPAPPLLDWTSWFASILPRLDRVPSPVLAHEFHRFLAAAALAVAEQVGQPRVLLTGGCFQSRLLTELVAAQLRAHGFSVYVHQRIPPNDGGLALGQALAARFATSRPDSPIHPAPCASPFPDASST